MITGEVREELEAIIPLEVLTAIGARGFHLDAVLDSGFNGLLALPIDLIQQLGYAFLQSEVFVLGDGSEVALDTYLGRVNWEGQSREIEIVAGDGECLLGTRMVQGYQVTIEFVVNGRVIIQPLAQA